MRWLSGNYCLSLYPISVDVMTIQNNQAVFTIYIKTHFRKKSKWMRWNCENKFLILNKWYYLMGENNPPINIRGIMKSLSYFHEIHVDSCSENFMQVFYGRELCEWRDAEHIVRSQQWYHPKCGLISLCPKLW